MNTYIETYTKRYGRLLFSLSGLLLLLALTGCRDSVFDRDGVDPAGVDCPSVTEGQEQEVQIPYLLPSAETMKPGTRALKVEDESTLDKNKTHLLVFDTQGKLLYEAKLIDIQPTAPQRGNLTARLKKTTDAVSLVLYANVEGTWTVPEAGTSKTDVAKSLTFSVSADKEWADGGRLPMWGEANKVPLDFDNPSSIIGAGKILHLIRAVARIDVGLNLKALTNSGAKDKDFDETAQPLKGKDERGNEVTYTLKSVALYRAADKGLIAPTDVTTGSEGYDALKHTPSQPTDFSPVTHTLSGTAISENILKRSLYVPETLNPQKPGVALSARPRLIVGLGRSDWGDKVKYYPIDFLTKNSDKGTFSYLHLLRNVRYKVSLLGVSGPGFDTPKDALEAAATRLSYVVIPFAESDMDKVAYDGPYSLSVDEDLLEVGRYGSLQDIGISTTWLEGWSVEIPKKLIDPMTGKEQTEANTLAEWVDFEGLTDGKPTNKEATNLVLKIKKQEPDAQGAVTPRAGCFLIRAGRMTRLVRVHQSGEANLEIAIFSDPEAKVPLQFIELSQRGLKAKSVDEQGNPLPLPGYRRFYVRTEPYFDPNEPQDIIPFLSHAGADRFLFYNYGESHFKDTAYDFVKEDAASLVVNEDNNSYSSVWADPEDYKDPASARFFRYTGRDNVWECVVTAPVMHRNMTEGDPGFFERRVNTYYANLQVKGQPSTKVNAELRLLQAEYNVVPYFDQKLTDCMILPDTSAFAIMDGASHQYYMAGNTPYILKYVGAKSDTNGSDDLLTAPVIGESGTYDFDGRKYVTHSFTTANDLTDQTRSHGYAEFQVSSPTGIFDPYTFHVELASGITQPESNTYLLKADSKVGLLIPLSIVNTAADYYQKLIDVDIAMDDDNLNFTNTDSETEYERRVRSFVGKYEDISLDRVYSFDRVTTWMVWTDINKPTKNQDGTPNLEPAGIKRLRTYMDGNGQQFVYVLPSGVKNSAGSGSKAGSVLVAARNESLDGSPTVWSWQVWIVDEYPGLSDMSYGGNTIVALDRPLGARRRPSEHYNDGDTWSYGFAYQWGRKDPFPYRKSLYVNAVKQRFWDQEGQPYSFLAATRGTRSNKGRLSVADGVGATYTVKESIRNPASIVSHQTVWMTEHLPFGNTTDTDKGKEGKRREALFRRATWRWMWERPLEDMSFFSRSSNSNAGLAGGKFKSPFDPSPYGFRIVTQLEARIMRQAFYDAKPIFGNNYVEGNEPVNVCPGTILDGTYTATEDLPRFNGGHFLAVSQYHTGKTYAPHYILRFGLTADGWKDASHTNATYNRTCGFSVVPILDSNNTAHSFTRANFGDITKYWPGYNKKKP